MSAPTHTERVRNESPLLWPALALLVIAVACFTYFWDGHRYMFPYSTKHAAPNWPPPVEAPPAGSPSSTTPALGSMQSLKLPTGMDLNVPEYGIESKLTAFIEDTSKPADKTTWFDFDRLLFQTNKATLEPSSNEQLENIANILKAFPKVQARIGGYTDNTGNAAANLQLSQERATNVMKELVSMGVSANRLDAKGYGLEHPVAENSTGEGRAKNRRISLRVTQK